MRRYFTILAILALTAGGCTVSRQLEDGARLVTKNTVTVEPGWPDGEKRDLSGRLLSLAEPKPNSRLFFLFPFRLWVYQRAADSSKKINRWLRERIGEPPALFDSAAARHSAANMELFLFNKGYLHARVAFDVLPASRPSLVRVRYRVAPDGLYRFGELHYEIADSAMRTLLSRDSTLEAAASAPFDMEKLVDERQRITETLLNNGYFNFSRQFVVFELDTSVESHRIDVYVKILPPREGSHRPWHLRNVYIIPDYVESLHQAGDYDTLVYKGYHILYRGPLKYKPQALVNGVFFDPGALYRQRDYRQTIERLTSLSIFRFVNIEMKKDPERQVLDVVIKLIPAKLRSLNFNVNASSSSYYFLGSELGMNYISNNLFHFTDQFRLGANGGIETLSDSGGGLLRLNTIEFNLSGDLYFPTLLNPFGIKIDHRAFNPRTVLSARYNYFRRLNYYTLNASNFSYRYEWTRNEHLFHQLSPIELSVLSVRDTTPAFNERLENNPILKLSFQDQLILGSKYGITYNSAPGQGHDFWYLRANIDMAGNLINTAFSLFSPGQNTLFGRPFSQYVRPDIELKYYHFMAGNQQLVTRFIAGVGVPLGQSEVLPYVKQFVIGGSNSIRAFRIRELGPGSTGSNGSSAGFNDRTGDMKLEGNLEYRFPITELFKGAVFVDAGNIWLLKDEENPDKVFNPARFYEDIAIGTGMGLRIDFSFFIIRLDLGVPVRVPFDTADNGWRIKSFFRDFAPLDYDWRRDHLRLNLAIGYPF